MINKTYTEGNVSSKETNLDGMGIEILENTSERDNGITTPIVDFVKQYADKKGIRLHMPGHKGNSFLGCEQYDITEIAGADSLYEADGIIAESEKNATKLFGTGRTLFSTEGSSQCIRAMLYLAVSNRSGKKQGKPLVIAARNVHKSFLYAAALLDMDVCWLWPEGIMDSLCSCTVAPKTLEETLKNLSEPDKVRLVGVYVTSPDYLGGMLDIKAIAKVCHTHDTILAVDNAHGAYLHFLEESLHPMDLGADICCDSAHKTLPVLTGGAYLHISKNAPENFSKHAKGAMALFGSTSPSYLTLISLDLCNAYLVTEYRRRLAEFMAQMHDLKQQLVENGWKLEGQEPMKLTICVPESMTGSQLAQKLRQHEMECEYADPQYLVFMLTPENTQEEMKALCTALGQNHLPYIKPKGMQSAKCQQKISIREAIFAEHEVIPVANAIGRICGAPTVSCPPAIPIVVSGEFIDKNILQIFEYYGISSLDVVS